MRRSWAYSASLAFLLVVVIVLVNRGVAQSVVQTGDVGLDTDSVAYLPADVITFNGNLDFAIGEIATTTTIALIVDGPQSLDVSLPLQSGTHDLSGQAGVTGNLIVKVAFENVASLSNQVIGIFKGVAQGAAIKIEAEWTPDQSTNAIGSYRAKLKVELDSPSTSLFSGETVFSIEDVAPAAESVAQAAPGSQGASIAATRTPTPRPTATRTPTPSPTPTVTPTSTRTSTATVTATLTPTSTTAPAQTPLPTSSPTLTPSPTPIPPTSTPAPTNTPESTPSPTPPSTTTPSPTPVANTPTSSPVPPEPIVLARQAPSTPSVSALASRPTFSPPETPVPASTEDGGIGIGIIGLIVLGVAIGAGIVGIVPAILSRR